MEASYILTVERELTLEAYRTWTYHSQFYNIYISYIYIYIAMRMISLLIDQYTVQYLYTSPTRSQIACSPASRGCTQMAVVLISIIYDYEKAAN